MKNSLIGVILSSHFIMAAEEVSKPVVVGNLLGQTGNNFFQIATTCALGWDNGADPFFPQLASLPNLYQHFFSRCKVIPSSDLMFEWIEPNACYHPIVYQPNMKIVGHFQSWKYFDHYRDRLVSLFAPISKDMQYMKKKYGWLIDEPHTVGIQIRYYWEDPYTYPQYGRDYLEKAMALFPSDSLFIVSSNRIGFAKEQVPNEGRRVIFLENEPAHIDFFLLSMCKDNIITNSSFGWWSAYLNQNPKKVIVCPKFWSGYDTIDLCPESWIKIEAERIDPTLVK